MGNVLAASAPPPSPPSSMSGLMPPIVPDSSSESLSTLEKPRKLENPGTIEDLHKKCKDVFPTNFEGAKLILTKGLSSHFQVSHTINMSSFTPSGYRFGATYVGLKQTSPSESYPVLLGDIDPNGNLTANMMHQFTDRIKGKIATQMQRNKLSVLQMSSDYRGDAYTLSMAVGNPDIINGAGVMVLHYLQSLTPTIAVGAELAYQRGPGIPGGYITVVSAAGRYTDGESTLSGSLGLSGCHLCFHKKASQQVQVGVELELNSRIQESTATIAYQVDLPKADLIFRGSVDTNWTVGAVLEKKLQPLPFSFALSGMINHSKHQFRLGCGLIIG